jgi:hypothetical protein
LAAIGRVGFIGVFVFFASAAAWLYLFFTASETARASTGPTEVRQELLGIPILESFRSPDGLGAHVFWGTPVLLLVPVGAITVVATIVEIARRQS